MLNDLIPPGRITDLSSEHMDGGKLIVSWTAPGGDYREGSVAGYNIVTSADSTEILNPKIRPDMRYT